jgi:hypothetical protein
VDAATAQTHLDAWEAADLAVAAGQSYSIAGRTLTRADAGEIRRMITHWQRIVDRYAVTAAGGTSGVALATWP